MGISHQITSQTTTTMFRASSSSSLGAGLILAVILTLGLSLTTASPTTITTTTPTPTPTPREAEQGSPGSSIPPPPVDNCTLPGRVCLRGGADHEGNVYIGVGSGISKPVCDDSWDSNDGIVVCRELGYPGLVKVTRESHYGNVSSDWDRSNPNDFAADNVRCKGSETRLADCSFDTQDDCSGGEGAGVVCDTRSPKEIEDERKMMEEWWQYYLSNLTVTGTAEGSI